jgi:hypothetical protein
LRQSWFARTGRHNKRSAQRSADATAANTPRLVSADVNQLPGDNLALAGRFVRDILLKPFDEHAKDS